MSAYYQIVVMTPLGEQVALFNEYSGMSYSLKLNDVGHAQFNLPIDRREMHKVFQTDSIIEIQRSVPSKGIGWYPDYLGFHRTPQRQITEAGNEFFTSYSRSLNDLLRRCWIPYPAGSFTPRGENGFVKKLGPADDIMKAIVRENVGPNVAESLRLITYANMDMPNFDVAPDMGQAPEWGGSFAYQNVLKTLQEIGIARSVDFAVVRTQRTPVQFSFVTGYPMFGADRTGTDAVIFSREFGNVKNISYTQSATDEVTAALVLGKGLEDDRSYTAGLGTRISASPYNRCELIKDARNQDDEDLTAEVEDILRLSAANESFVFQALQESQFIYGRDYFLGDRVIVRYDDITRTKRLVAVNVKVDDNGEEQVDLEFSDYIAQPASYESVIRAIAQRLVRLEHKVDI